MLKKEKSVGAVIFRKNKNGGEIKYLLLHYDAGHWDYVKGHVEKGEGEIETLLREAKEEAGLNDLQIFDDFKKKIHYFHRRGKALISKDVVFYIAQTKTKMIKLSFEHKAYKWLGFKDATNTLTYSNAKEVLKEAEWFVRKKDSKRQR